MRTTTTTTTTKTTTTTTTTTVLSLDDHYNAFFIIHGRLSVCQPERMSKTTAFRVQDAVSITVLSDSNLDRNFVKMSSCGFLCLLIVSVTLFCLHPHGAEAQRRGFRVRTPYRRTSSRGITTTTAAPPTTTTPSVVEEVEEEEEIPRGYSVDREKTRYDVVRCVQASV